jgi:phosphoribosylaminoimidazole-succinocarboxamide synthase
LWQKGGAGVALLETNLSGLPVRRGKVRDVYDLGGGRLLFIATDRLSAFDWVMPNGIPDKGRVLTLLSAFWFGRLGIQNHLLSTDVDDAGLELSADERDALAGRSMVVRKLPVVPFECVVRGYLSGSGWKEYLQAGTVCGEPIAPGLLESDRIDPPVFTPATKAESGHDENVPFSDMADTVPQAERLRSLSLAAYRSAAEYALTKGLILADTKFEWGLDDAGNPVLVDEVLTPDSSRYWPADTYEPGGPQPSFDKQYVRDWLEATGWDKSSPPPELPEDVVARTRAKYIDAYETLTGQAFPWK